MVDLVAFELPQALQYFVEVDDHVCLSSSGAVQCSLYPLPVYQCVCNNTLSSLCNTQWSMMRFGSVCNIDIRSLLVILSLVVMNKRSFSTWNPGYNDTPDNSFGDTYVLARVGCRRGVGECAVCACVCARACVLCVRV